MFRFLRQLSESSAFLFVLIFLPVLLVYSSLLQAGFVWDDDFLVTQNVALRSLLGLRDIWFAPGATIQYYPLTFTAFWMQYQLWGHAPLGYHVINVLLHALNACLVFVVLRRLGFRGAWLAACVFAVHPVQVESVAWVSELKNLMSGMFALGALSLWLKYFLTEKSGVQTARRDRVFCCAAAFFLLAVLSKTVTWSLPVVLVLLLWWQRVRVSRREITALGILQAAGLAVAGLTVWLEKSAVGAAGAGWDLTVWQRLIIAGKSVWFYVGKALWPLNLSFIYPRWQVNPLDGMHWLWPGGVVVAVAVLWSARSRIGRGPFTGAAVFLITIFPALGFVDFYPMKYSFVADHFQYLAGIAVLALTVAVWVRLPFWRRPLSRFVVAGAVLGGLSVLSWIQAANYCDSETLYKDVLRKNPAATLAYVNLGNILMEQGRVGQALQLYETGLKHDPQADRLRLNLGVALARQGEYVRAQKEFAKLLEHDRYAPYGHFNLALVAEAREDAASARRHYRQAVRANPFYVLAYRRLAESYLQDGETSEAIACYERSLNMAPRGRDWYLKKPDGYSWSDKLNRDRTPYQLLLAEQKIPLRLGRLYERAGRVVSALAVYESGLKLNPYDSALKKQRQKALTYALATGMIAEKLPR